MTELNDILTQLADEVIEQAQRNIGAIRSVRTWNGRTVKRRIDTTGTLRNNLGYSITQTAGNPTDELNEEERHELNYRLR